MIMWRILYKLQLLFLESADPEREIRIYLNTPGGSVFMQV